jgi:hypothetical protein
MGPLFVVAIVSSMLNGTARVFKLPLIIEGATQKVSKFAMLLKSIHNKNIFANDSK